MNSILKDKIVVITGAGAGIGKATTQLFAEKGAIIYAVDIKGLEWIESLSLIKSNIHQRNMDITDFAAVKNAILSIKKKTFRQEISQ